MNQRNCELDSFEELVKKAVKAKAKAALRLGFYACKTDYRCLWGTRFAYNAKVQGSSKDLKPEEPKFRSQKLKASSPQRSKQLESSEKKSRREKKKQRHQIQACKDFNLATSDYTTTLSCGKAQKDLSDITYFNCDKKRHYANKCPKPKEELDSIED